MSKITNKWDYLSEKEKEKQYKELDVLYRSIQLKDQKIEERIKEIKKLWPIGVK